MPAQVFVLDKVPESKLVDIIKEAGDDDAAIVTAINDGKGTFTVESTFIQAAGAAAGTITVDGKMSTFGGPNDPGVKPDEGLAIFDPGDVAANPDLFLPAQPPDTTGLARRLNPQAKYIACRWDYTVTPKSFLKTIKVKVTNPANHATAEARPADWGPNLDTGRAADLSPGLAQALGLNDTGLECKVEIPTPAAAPPPVQGGGVATGVNLAQIDGTVFGQGMSRTLVAVTTSDQTTYWIINLVGQDEGGQSLLRHAGNQTEVIVTDTTVFPVKAGDKIPQAIADELNKAAPDLVADTTGGNPPQPGHDIDAKVFASAKNFVGHDTSAAPGTEGGNLACAWAVNQVARLALGKPISTVDGGNGISTAQMFDVLKAHHTALGSAGDAKPGVVIIAPSTDKVHGHVGIVGATTGGVNDTLVYSNSSAAAEFQQNYTIGKFTSHYVGKGLQVLFFKLNAGPFQA